jgi:TolA-binding protein
MPAIPAFSQDTLAEARIRKMEAEIRALQRKVFPGGDGKFFAPEITPQDATGGTAAAGQPATSAVTDILTRMDALESQLARLTAQIEQNSNRIAQLEAREPAAAPAATEIAGPPTADAPENPAAPAAAQANLDAMTGGASKPAASPAPAAAPAAAASKPPPDDRVRAVSAIVKPQTDDPADDEYSYGFRLWDAKFYPEAQQQLKLFLEKHPSHWRASWGRNLLGRAYLDDGNPREAAKWFLQNYQADKSGGRAPDSLLYLAGSMKELKDDKRACIALAEFSETYAAEAAGRLKGQYDATQNGLDCSG